MQYTVQAAKDAQKAGYGTKSYWDYLEAHGKELQAKFLARGDHDNADLIMNRSLVECMKGNNGL